MSDQTENIIRKHVHDVRNHLNCLEMDAQFLADLFPDTTTEPNKISERLISEITEIESRLRFLSACIYEPDVEAVSVVDLFNLWQSRSRKLITATEIDWQCTADSEFIDVDARMVADLLGVLLSESITSDLETQIHASVLAENENGTVCFVISGGKAIPDQATSQFPTLIEKNGGQLKFEENQITCSFPVC